MSFELVLVSALPRKCASRYCSVLVWPFDRNGRRHKSRYPERKWYCRRRCFEVEHFGELRALDRATRPKKPRSRCGFIYCKNMVTQPSRGRRSYCRRTCEKKARCLARLGGAVQDECEICGAPIDFTKTRLDQRVCGKKKCARERANLNRRIAWRKRSGA